MPAALPDFRQASFRALPTFRRLRAVPRETHEIPQQTALASTLPSGRSCSIRRQ
jgi:hypothetical protein